MFHPSCHAHLEVRTWLTAKAAKLDGECKALGAGVSGEPRELAGTLPANLCLEIHCTGRRAERVQVPRPRLARSGQDDRAAQLLGGAESGEESPSTSHAPPNGRLNSTSGTPPRWFELPNHSTPLPAPPPEPFEPYTFPSHLHAPAVSHPLALHAFCCCPT